MRRPRRCWGPLIANGANGGLFGNGWSGGLLIQDGLPGGSIITDNNPPKSVALQQLQQVVTISGLDQSTGSLHQLLVVDPAHAPRHFFGDADLQALPTLQGPDEIGGVQQRVECPGVQPRCPAGQHLDRQPT